MEFPFRLLEDALPEGRAHMIAGDPESGILPLGGAPDLPLNVRVTKRKARDELIVFAIDPHAQFPEHTNSSAYLLLRAGRLLITVPKIAIIETQNSV